MKKASCLICGKQTSDAYEELTTGPIACCFSHNEAEFREAILKREKRAIELRQLLTDKDN